MNKSSWAVIALLLFCFAYVALVAVPQRALHPPRMPVTTTPADEGLAFEDFVVSPEGSELKLAGWWIPADNAKATLVFIHGGGWQVARAVRT